jgi:hypothetical protein
MDLAPLTSLLRLGTLYCNFPHDIVCTLPPLAHHFGALTNLALTTCDCQSVCVMANAPSLQTLCIETVVHRPACLESHARWPDERSQQMEWDYLVRRVCTCPSLSEFAMDGYAILPLTRLVHCL